MIPFLPGEMQILQQPMVQARTDSCLIARYERVDDGSGGYTDLWIPDLDPVSCRVTPAAIAATERAVSGGVALVTTYGVKFGGEVEVNPRDRVLWTEARSGLVRLLQIVATGARSWTFDHHLRCTEVGTTPVESSP